MDNQSNLEAVFCVINAGFSDQVMQAARKAGAGGGTIIRGRGTASPKAEKLFNVPIQPEKEIVIMLVSASIKDDLLRSVYASAGLDSEAHGIIFSVPVDQAVGLKDYRAIAEQKAKEASEPRKK